MSRPYGKPTMLVLAAVAVTLLSGVGVAMFKFGLDTSGARDYVLACDAFEAYDYDLASAHLKKYLSIQPDDATARLMAAQTARRLEDFEEAKAQLALAQKHGIAERTIETERQLMSIQAGDLSGVEQWRRYCEEQPDGPDTVNVLLAIFEGGIKTRKRPIAEWSLDMWFQRRTGKIDRAQGLIARGRLNLLVEGVPQAKADFRQAVELAPEYFVARVWMTSLQLHHESHQALPHLDWLRRHRPDEAIVKFLTGQYYRTVGQPEMAVAPLDEALASTPEGMRRVPLLVERAKVALDLDQPADAEKWLQNAKALAPEHRDVNAAFAACLLRLPGREEEAKRYQDKVRSMNGPIVGEGGK